MIDKITGGLPYCIVSRNKPGHRLVVDVCNEQFANSPTVSSLMFKLNYSNTDEELASVFKAMEVCNLHIIIYENEKHIICRSKSLQHLLENNEFN